MMTIVWLLVLPVVVLVDVLLVLAFALAGVCLGVAWVCRLVGRLLP